MLIDLWAEPATGQQKRAITKLCIIKGVREELENRIMTKAEARTLIYELRNLPFTQSWLLV